MSQLTTKHSIRPVWPAKTQISLYTHPVCQGFSFTPFAKPGGCRRHMQSAKTLDQTDAGWSESSLSTNLNVGFVARWLISCLLSYTPISVLNGVFSNRKLSVLLRSKLCLLGVYYSLFRTEQKTCLLSSYFWKGVYSKWKECSSICCAFFPFRVDRIREEI